MLKKTIETTQFTLETKDLHTIRECLNYCYHRLSKHIDKCGITGYVNLNEVSRLRMELGITKTGGMSDKDLYSRDIPSF